ncbi:MAG TPA: septation regulator SpoVG [Thermoanaerobaculia bacterium]|nr:septation regulator SpoVG [Thermoanaerobaculia bacterium]HUM31013.1 septation regulator SpoVG [Thermoanaerobaculia bacterium]HXK69311.1 septation regulator SpoVG [Thermoanaerobaculia bacterium]
MEITQVRVYPVEDTKLKGFASIVFDNCFLVSDIKIIQGKDGFFVSMPSKRKRNGQYKDIAHPINRDMRTEIENLIFSEYEKVTGELIEARAMTQEVDDASLLIED